MAEQKESPVSRSPNNDEGGGHGEGETRLQGSLLSGPERRLLDWIIPRLPRWVTPDLLTGSALAAMVAAGFAYAGSGTDPRLLHVVNIGLFIHWFGDSLDGGLARARNQSRPRYGFYVDHMSDALVSLKGFVDLLPLLLQGCTDGISVHTVSICAQVHHRNSRSTRRILRAAHAVDLPIVS